MCKIHKYIYFMDWIILEKSDTYVKICKVSLTSETSYYMSYTHRIMRGTGGQLVCFVCLSGLYMFVLSASLDLCMFVIDLVGL